MRKDEERKESKTSYVVLGIALLMWLISYGSYKFFYAYTNNLILFLNPVAAIVAILYSIKVFTRNSYIFGILLFVISIFMLGISVLDTMKDVIIGIQTGWSK